MGVEPLPNIRDGILVERLVKIMRYVSDMRGREYVVEGPEGVRRRQRLSVAGSLNAATCITILLELSH